MQEARSVRRQRSPRDEGIGRRRRTRDQQAPSEQRGDVGRATDGRANTSMGNLSPSIDRQHPRKRRFSFQAESRSVPSLLLDDLERAKARVGSGLGLSLDNCELMESGGSALHSRRSVRKEGTYCQRASYPFQRARQFQPSGPLRRPSSSQRTPGQNVGRQAWTSWRRLSPR